MSDFLKSKAQDDELEAILKEMKGLPTEETEDISSAKEWSLDDIDKLLAGEMPSHSEKKPEPSPYKRFFTNEFNADMFSVKPIEEEKPEIEDISSGDPIELDGQEKFFEEFGIDEFDIDSFELETVIMPEDEPTPTVNKYNNSVKEKTPPKAQEPEEEKPTIDYRERFFQKLTLEDIGFVPESDPDPVGPYDKSGTVVFKHDSEKQDTFLDPLPTVKAAEDIKDFDIEKTKIASPVSSTPKTPEKQDNDVEGQIVLTGFTEVPEEEIPSKDNEDTVEEKLWNKRQEKAKAFVVEGIDDDDFGEGFDEISEEVDEYVAPETNSSEAEESPLLVDTIGEYTDPSERNKIYTLLGNRIKRKRKTTIIVAVIETVLLLLALVSFVAELADIENAILRNPLIFNIADALLIIGAIFIDSERFFDAFSNLFKSKKVTGDTAIACAAAVALIETTVSAIKGGVYANDIHIPVFGAVAVAGILISRITEVIDAKRIYHNFEICAFNYEHNMYAVHSLENENEIFELGRGLLMGNAELIYSSNVAFPANFIKNSDSRQDNEKYSTLMLLASAGLSLIAAVIVGIIRKDIMAAIAVFAASVTLSAPIFGKFIPSYITYIHNRGLNHEGTMIVSLDAAEKTAAANAVVLDAADIFDRNSCTMHGMKSFETMRIDVVLLYAAAMVIKSGGPLKECFEQVVDGRQDLLPPVRELVYEDKMGISARIYEQKVLLGNRNMLIHHNIEAPDIALEQKYSHDGRKVIYLACNEKLAALFVVSYSADENIKNHLKLLEKSGIQTLVRTNDVNVTEELISERFGINSNTFKILSSVAGRLYKRRKDTISDRLDVGVIHDGKPESMLKAIAAACKMTIRGKIGTVLQFVMLALGVALSVVLGCKDSGITTVDGILIMLGEIGLTLIALTPFDYIIEKYKNK